MHSTIFQALADPARFRIVELLSEGEHSVNEIVGRMHIHQSGVSRHLRILEEHGFVQMRPDGQKRHYSLRAEPFQKLDQWMANYRAFWEARLDKFGDALAHRQKTASRKGGKR